MAKDRIKGSAEQSKGKVKEWAGKITGDSKTEAEGKADQVKSKVQNTIGGIKDTVRGEWGSFFGRRLVTVGRAACRAPLIA
jgi:uncharacterized protein YjbJ (UPF0337 family)